MRTGDSVKHIPSGETWTVAWADQDDIISHGWPQRFVRREDCELIESCSDEDHWELVEKIARGYGFPALKCYRLLKHRPFKVKCSTDEVETGVASSATMT
jgi:hypothetical protein